MANLRFEWDEAKNLANQLKHGIRFEDAVEVFFDPLYLLVHDRVRNGETRLHTFGVVKDGSVLMVVHTVDEEDEGGTAVEVIGIISARPAAPKERRRYEIEKG